MLPSTSNVCARQVGDISTGYPSCCFSGTGLMENVIDVSADTCLFPLMH